MIKIIRLHVLIYIKVRLLCIIFSQCNFQRLCARCLPPVREQCIQHTPNCSSQPSPLPRSSLAFTSVLIQINFSSCLIYSCFRSCTAFAAPLLFCLIGTTVVCRCLLHFSSHHPTCLRARASHDDVAARESAQSSCLVELNSSSKLVIFTQSLLSSAFA